jgi:hypothetical protein
MFDLNSYPGFEIERKKNTKFFSFIIGTFLNLVCAAILILNHHTQEISESVYSLNKAYIIFMLLMMGGLIAFYVLAILIMIHSSRTLGEFKNPSQEECKSIFSHLLVRYILNYRSFRYYFELFISTCVVAALFYGLFVNQEIYLFAFYAFLIVVFKTILYFYKEINNNFYKLICEEYTNEELIAIFERRG